MSDTANRNAAPAGNVGVLNALVTQADVAQTVEQTANQVVPVAVASVLWHVDASTRHLIRSRNEVTQDVGLVGGSIFWGGFDNTNGLSGVDALKGDYAYARSTGKLYVHDGSTWQIVDTIKGQDGAVGPKGDAGPAGPKGDTGTAGQAGSVGPAGPQGIAGPAGSQGPKGDTGATGQAGATGQTGAAGASGFSLGYGSFANKTLKTWAGQVTTDASGNFTIDYTSAGFTAPPKVNAQARCASNGAADAVIANLQAPGNSTCGGFCTRNASITLLGLVSLLPLSKSGAGVVVDVFAIGF